MTDGNTAQSAIETVKRIAHEVVREEFRQLRGQIQEVCLAAVEAALGQILVSERFARAVREAAPGGGAPADLDARIRALITASIPAIVGSDEVQAQFHTLLKEKGKEIFKQAIFGGSLDLKKVVAKVVEQSLENRGAAQGGQPGATPPDVGAAVEAHLKQHLGKDISRAVQSEIKTFLSSELMKEMLDSKFRAIDVYLKTDLIPKVVKREIAKAEETHA
jgi:hypothetical protein